MEQVEYSGGNVDRISSLPDCLLHLIMSFLTARQAIQLCILSKRWKNLWTTLPVLVFNDYDFRKGAFSFRKSTRDEIEAFRNFLNLTLLLRDNASLLHTFRLCCRCFKDSFFVTVHPWIRIVLQHNIRVLEIDTSADPTTSSLPPYLFTCQTLEDLSLTIYDYRLTARIVNLPTLRRLHMGNMHVGQNIMDTLLCGCPMLEDLHLKSLYELSSITSQSLKYLEIQNFCCDDEKREATIREINTPNLLCFHYFGCPGYLQNNMHWNMPSVHDVSIAFHCYCFEDGCAESNVFCAVSNAQYLELKGAGIKGVLENELPKCPNFHYLKSLLVESLCLTCYFNLLASFTEHLPVLEKLSLDLWFCQFRAKPIEMSQLRCKRLKQVEFKYASIDTVDHLLKCLLDSAQLGEAQIIMTHKGV